MTTTTKKTVSRRPAVAFGPLGKRLPRACGLLCGRHADPRCSIARIRLCRDCFRRVHRIRRMSRDAQAAGRAA